MTPSKNQVKKKAQSTSRKKVQRKKSFSLHDVFINKLQVLLDVENAIIKALPKMIQKASDVDVQSAFEEHLQQTEEQARRLEKALSMLSEKARPMKSEAIRGIIEDASWVMNTINGEEVRDANLVAAAQYVEHYEIAGYGSALAWAEIMGHTEVADLLQQTLTEEEETDRKLSELAESKINDRAMRANPDGMPVDAEVTN